MTEKLNLGVILFPLKPIETENKKQRKHSHSFTTKSASTCVQALTCGLGCWFIVMGIKSGKTPVNLVMVCHLFISKGEKIKTALFY